MHTPVVKNTTEDELSNIAAHLEHVNKVLKWSITDLEAFILTLKGRISAEETYVTALLKINRLPNNEYQKYFGDNYMPCFQKATQQHQQCIDKTLSGRKDFISIMKSQLEQLSKVKDSLEHRRKKVKAVLSEKNTNYEMFRTRDITRLHKAYFNKCAELAYTQQQEEIYNDSNHLSPVIGRASSDEPRPRISSESHHQSRDIDASSIHSNLGSSPSGNSKKGMTSFINQMKSQFATVDPSKQTVRYAKLKKEIADTDHEYRQGIRILEFLRKKQVETSVHAMRHVEAILFGKTDALKNILITISSHEQAILSVELESVKESLDCYTNLDDQIDSKHFFDEYDKMGFTRPKRIYYENYYYGTCKDVLFGSSLTEYANEHHRTVPLIVTKLIEQLELQGGLEREGIYRISGRQANIDLLKSEFEKDEENVEMDSKYDVFTIASVLKVYLRELKHPLFQFSMQDRMEYSKIQDANQRKLLLQTKLAELSKPQRDTLEAVIIHLSKVASYSRVNKMTMENLSLIFTPAIFHDHNQVENHGEWYSDKVLEDLVHDHETLFSLAEKQQQQQLQQQQQQQQQHYDYATTAATENSEANSPTTYASSISSSRASICSTPTTTSPKLNKTSLNRSKSISIRRKTPPPETSTEGFIKQ